MFGLLFFVRLEYETLFIMKKQNSQIFERGP